MKQQPAPLQPGEKIGLAATARAIQPSEISHALAVIQAWGYEPVLAPHLFERNNQFAGTDEQRAEDLQTFLEDEKIKAILCVRGGYGTIRTLAPLLGKKFLQPKWLIGFSDVTVLHTYFGQHLNWQSVHGPMAFSFKPNAEVQQAVEALHALLQGHPPMLEAGAHPFNTTGKATAELVGGNLSVLYSTMGTPFEMDTRGKILFLEDLDEYLYHIDRMLMNLKLAGKLTHLKGLVIGGMTDMNDNATPFGKQAEEIIREHTSELNIPIGYNFPCGHMDKNMPLLLGAAYRLKVTTEGSMLQPV
jgi:muramoyltetrapeptide carboxypeptidase